MSFGQKILQKYGYEEGKGLGKNGNGITVPIKANFKFDNSGLGDKGPVKEDHWWERVFNEASSNVSVQKSESGKIALELKDADGVEITNKSFSLKKLKQTNTTLQYGNFLKSATLLANVGKEEDIEGHLSTNDIEIKPITVLSDADLFAACGGRTAHKGARHGLNLTGKLQRIAEQERILLEKMKSKHNDNKHEVFREPFTKKSKKNPLSELNSSIEDISDESILPIDSSDYILKPSRKRKKHDKQQEAQLVSQINGIGLDESILAKEPKETEHEEDEPQPYNGTPVRKKKKSKKKVMLESIQESEKQSSDEGIRKKKKKGKRKLEEFDESMVEPKELKEKPLKKHKKKKLNDSYEPSGEEEDVADKINAEREAFHLSQAKKKTKKAHKREKQRASRTAEHLAGIL